GLSGGDIADTDDLLISYDYTPVAHSILPIGKASAPTYYGVWIEEELTGSATSKAEYQIYKARIGIDGGFAINNAEQGGDLPIIIQATLAAWKTDLGKLYNYARTAPPGGPSPRTAARRWGDGRGPTDQRTTRRAWRNATRGSRRSSPNSRSKSRAS